MKSAHHIIFVAFYASALGAISLLYSIDILSSSPTSRPRAVQMQTFNWGEGSEAAWQDSNQAGN